MTVEDAIATIGKLTVDEIVAALRDEGIDGYVLGDPGSDPHETPMMRPRADKGYAVFDFGKNKLVGVNMYTPADILAGFVRRFDRP